MILILDSFRTVEGLMGHEVVHGGELDAAGGADQLDEGRRGRSRWRWTRHARLSGLAVVFLVGDEVLVPAEDYVALFTSVGHNYQSYYFSATQHYRSRSATTRISTILFLSLFKFFTKLFTSSKSKTTYIYTYRQQFFSFYTILLYS